MWKPLAAVFLFTLLLDSCNVVGGELNTAIGEDGSGNVELGIGYLLDEEKGETIDCTPDETTAGATTWIEQRGAETWCVMQVPFTSLSGLRDFYLTLFEGVSRIHCLALEDGTLIYDVEIVPDEPPEESADGSAVYWRVTGPGEIESTNATSLEGNVAVRSISGPDDPLRFRINAPEGSVCPTSSVRLILNVDEDGTGTAGLRAPLAGDDEQDQALASRLQAAG